MDDLTIGKNFDEEVKNAVQQPLIWINQEVLHQKEENVKLKEKLKKINEIVAEYGIQTIPSGLGQCPIEVTASELNTIYRLSKEEGSVRDGI